MRLPFTALWMPLLAALAAALALIVDTDDRADEHAAPDVRSLTSRLHPEQQYYLYVPPTHDPDRPYRLLVVIHGYSRTAAAYAERFVEFARARDSIVLAPLFPDSIHYQDLGVGEEYRTDQRLLELVEEVAADYPLEASRFDLFGFSGGAQFSHRFLYLHPDRLRSVVVASPGTVTLPSRDTPWPEGVGDLQRVFGVPFDPEAVGSVPLLLLVGQADLGTADLDLSRSAMRFGPTRLARARSLHAALDAAGLAHTYLEIPAVGHTLDRRILAPAIDFLSTDR